VLDITGYNIWADERITSNNGRGFYWNENRIVNAKKKLKVRIILEI